MDKLFKEPDIQCIMGVFDNVLKDSESLFRDTVALDFSHIPKPILYREKEQHFIANCMKPLFQERPGRNLLIYGPPGIGKTVAVKHLLRELEEKTDDIIPIYINCWQKNTSYKIMLEICELIEYKFTHNKKTDELFKIVAHHVNKKSAVFIFDEIDKVEDFDFLYFILEEIYNKSIMLITNYKDKLFEIDDRIKSRLLPELLNFKEYNEEETKGILQHRLKFAFQENVWEDKAFAKACKKTFELKDIRSGLYILKEAGNDAEDKAQRSITEENVNIAIEKMEQFSIKNSTDLDNEANFILKIARENPNTKIGELFKIYQKKGGNVVYKTFQRKITYLDKNRFIATERIMGGPEGTTTIINPENKKITDF